MSRPRDPFCLVLLLALCLTRWTFGAPPSPAEKAGVRADRYGDPLPPRAVARLGTVRLRHGHHVVTLAFSPDGKTLASGGRDGIRLWDVGSGKEKLTLAGHPRGITSLAFSPDGKILASGGSDPVVRFWDLAYGRELRSCAGHRKTVWCVAFSPDGRLLASAGDDNTARLWEVGTGKEKRILPGFANTVTSVAFSPDGKTLALAGGFYTGVRLVDVGTGQTLRSQSGPEDLTARVAFSPDGKVLASWGRHLRTWDVATGRKRRSLRGREGGAATAAFSPDGRTLATGGYGGGPHILLWDLKTGEERRTLAGHYGDTACLTFSPDGKTLASGGLDDVIHLWDLATGKEVLQHGGHRGSVEAVAFHPDGRALASAGDRTVCLWDVATSRELRRFSWPENFARCVAFSPDGKTLAAGNGQPFAEVGGQEVRLWRASSGELLRTLPGEGDLADVFFVAFMPDGEGLVAGSQREGLQFWGAGGRLRRKIGLARLVRTRAAALAPDGEIVAACCSDYTVRVWEFSSGKELFRVKSQEPTRVHIPRSVAFSPDGNLLASGHSDRTVRLWEVATGRKVLQLTGHGEDDVSALAFSPDGRLLATGGEDSQVLLWDLATGKLLLKLTGHRGRVNALAFSPDGNLLASASWDTTVLLWDTSRIVREGRRPSRLSTEELETLWNDLAGEDAARAHRAVWMLATHPQQAVPLIRKGLGSAQEEEKRIPQWVADLDHPSFKVRSRAGRELRKWGDRARPLLQDALAGNLSPEQRRHLTLLLRQAERSGQPAVDRMRARCLEVLEHVRTPEARKVLEGQATGASEGQTRNKAKAALERLARRDRKGRPKEEP